MGKAGTKLRKALLRRAELDKALREAAMVAVLSRLKAK
jgi:hypothetical protein